MYYGTMTPEEYRGLYGEVVTADCYKLRSLDFIPDLVFDIGANVGVFTRYARELWPEARIVCVEPSIRNFERLKNYTNPRECVFLNQAIGSGRIQRSPEPANGAQEAFLCEGLGYPSGSLADYEATDVDSVTLSSVMCMSHWASNNKVVVKIDCEGGENSIISHKPSNDMLRCADYITGEYHHFAAHGGVLEQVKTETAEWLDGFGDTHDVVVEHPNFYMRKRDGNQKPE